MSERQVTTLPNQASESSDGTLKRSVIVPFDYGMHMRPLTKIVTLARQYKAAIFLHYDGRRIDARDMFDLLTLKAPRGAEVVIECSVEPDGPTAMEELIRIFTEVENGTPGA